MSEEQLYWILLYVEIGLAVGVFVLLYWITAPYGRHGRGGWGPTIPARWGWVLMESPAVMVPLLCFVWGNRQSNAVAIFFLALWLLHYLQRTFVFPFLMRSAHKPFPLVVLGMALLFNLLNGYVNGRYLFTFAPLYSTEWFWDVRLWLGTALFLGGWVINLHSDHVLRHLRQPGESRYKIPQGGFFRYVSSANYFGELLEWTGWAILTWSWAGLAFALFTAGNLVPRAWSHHQWYRRQFPDYPPERKAILPLFY